MRARSFVDVWLRHSWTLAASLLLLLSATGAAAVTLTSVTMRPASVVNGVSSTATVTLGAPAGSGGVIVWLTSQDQQLAPVPYNVTVPEGKTSAFVVVETGVVVSPTQVIISAFVESEGVTKTATLTITPREPVRGVEGDLWGDVILGKPDFTEVTPNEVVPYKVFNPGGVFVDRTVGPGRAYIWDSGNSRILGIDLATCYAGASPCSPQIVIGQPSGSDHSACNGDSGFQRFPTRASASAGSLCGIPEGTLSILENKSFVTMAGDADGILYVPDAYNNRVLKYVSPFTTDLAADEVWGQADFSGNLCNRGASLPTASTLCFTSGAFSAGGVALDSAGNLWVAEYGNNRVVRFPKDSGTGVIAKTADIVLGQQDFAGHDYGSGLAEMKHPSSVRFGPTGKLYVADSDNNRVLVFTPSPDFVSGMSAALFGSNFANPFGLEVDPAGNGLWVNDTFNSMVELWDWTGSAPTRFLGGDTWPAPPGGQCASPFCYSGGGIGIDFAGNVLPSVYTNGQDVLRFSAPIPAPLPGVVIQPDKRFFSPPDGYNSRGLKGLRSGGGLAIFGDQLIVGDAGRLLFWDGLNNLTNGKPADGQVGIPEFHYQYDCCGYLKTDTAGRLWVQKFNGGIDVHTLPLVNGGPQPTTILLPGPIPVLGGGSLEISNFLAGFVPVGQGAFLWVSDVPNNRVLRIRDPLTSPLVDVVLGQVNTTGTLCNRGLIPPPNQGTGQVPLADMICHPGALSLDRQGNLFVSDHGPEADGNWRLLRFAASLFPTNNTTTLFAVPATKIFPWEGGQPAITFEPAFDSANRMVVGYNSIRDGNFVGVYYDPAGPETNPDTYLNDFSSYPVAAVFDANDNLYVGEANRSRVLVYRRPLAPLPTVSLSITKTGAGSGTVTSVPAGISCGAACSATFPSGTGVALTTAPAASSFFAGWSGDVDCSDGLLTMNANKSCTATFELRPDLVVSVLTVPTSAVAGSTITVTDTTRNQVGTALASKTRFYLSTNATWDAADTPIGSRDIPGLASGTASTGLSTLSIPGGKATANYYIIAKADADGVLTETNPNNNTKAVSIRISPPDLIVSGVSVPTTGGAGLSFMATSTTKNQANTGPAPPSTTKFYLSTNTTLDGSDPEIGAQDIRRQLGPGDSEFQSTLLTIPPATARGTYYVIAKADGDNLILETLENNNTAFDTIVIGPDLVVSALTVPATGGPGMQINVTDTTKNQGGGQAAASTTNFYLSTNTTYGAGDILLGRRDVGPLGPGDISAGGPTPLTIPVGTALGTYYILAVADSSLAVNETNENNNTHAAVIRLSPDLLISALSVPPNVHVGTPPFNVTDTTKNQGQGIADASTTSFYLSTNATWDAGDVLLTSRGVPILDYGGTSPGTTSVTIPAGTAPGKYFILARADAAGHVTETSENNNVLGKAITILP